MTQLFNFFKNIREQLKIEYIYRLSTFLIFFILLNLILNFAFLGNLKSTMLDYINEDAYSKIKIGLTEYAKRQNQDLDIITDNIIKEINISYTDHTELRNDLYNFHEDSKLVKIIRKNIDGISDIIIMNSDKVLMGNYHSYNMNSFKNNVYFNVNVQDFYRNFKNPKLVKQTFDDIFNLIPLNTDKLLGFEKGFSNITLDEFNFDSIYNQVSKNISLIDSFYFISYSYLTETGDIFNVEDYDIYGNPVENDKIVLIKLFSYSDLDNPEIKNEINKVTEKRELIEMRFDNVEKTIAAITFGSTLICGILLITILMVFDKKIKEIKD